MDPALKKAIELQRKGELKGAIEILQNSANRGSRIPQVYYFLSVLLEATGEFEPALDAIEKAVELAPKEADFWFSKGTISENAQRYQLASQAYKKCLHVNPGHVHALVNLSLLYQRERQLETSLEYAKRALKAGPTEKKAWLATIGTLGFLRQFDEGIQVCQQAQEIFREDPEILHMTGNILLASGWSDDALQLYERALQKAPDSVPILVSMGDFQAQYRNGRDAIPYLEKALSLQPNSLDAMHRRGIAYLNAGFPADAVRDLLEVVQKDPQKRDAFDGLLLAAQYLEDAEEEEIFNLHLQWSKQFEETCETPSSDRENSMPKPSSGQLRIGLLSPDFRNHSVARFITPLLRRTEGSGCQLICYSDVKQKNTFTEELESIGSVEWIYSYTLTDEALHQKIQSDKIDVLVDLSGHTGNNRLPVFAKKPSPIQVSWLGYPNTTGLSSIDYRLSDEIADPSGQSDALSSEKIIRLAGGFHCFEPPIDLPDVGDTPALKNGYVTFGSFNNQSKINQLTLQRWASILDAIPQSRLLLKNQQLRDARNKEHWLRAMESLGISPSRVEMVGYTESLEEHYLTYHRVDIALDTFPYNGTTTTCEALWMGVPVLTIPGNSQRSRTAASLLTHAGLADWVATDETMFVAKATINASNLEFLNQLRKSLRKKVMTSSIGDGPAFAKKFFDTLKMLAF